MIDEEISRSTIAISVRVSKLTARSLAYVLGTAYRLAAGAGLGEKLLEMIQTIGPAFADFAPGVAPFDWLVGIAGAAGLHTAAAIRRTASRRTQTRKQATWSLTSRKAASLSVWPPHTARNAAKPPAKRRKLPRAISSEVWYNFLKNFSFSFSI